MPLNNHPGRKARRRITTGGNMFGKYNEGWRRIVKENGIGPTKQEELKKQEEHRITIKLEGWGEKKKNEVAYTCKRKNLWKYEKLWN